MLRSEEGGIRKTKPKPKNHEVKDAKAKQDNYPQPSQPAIYVLQPFKGLPPIRGMKPGPWLFWLAVGREKEKTALLVGQYVHFGNDGNLGEFIENTAEIYTRQNTLRADFVLADKMIETLRNDR